MNRGDDVHREEGLPCKGGLRSPFMPLRSRGNICRCTRRPASCRTRMGFICRMTGPPLPPVTCPQPQNFGSPGVFVAEVVILLVALGAIFLV